MEEAETPPHTHMFIRTGDTAQLDLQDSVIVAMPNKSSFILPVKLIVYVVGLTQT